MESNIKITILVIAAFIIWFSSIWAGVLTLLSIIGGWKKLSRLYPLTFPQMKNQARKFPMSSISLGFVRYRSTVNIYFNESGIILETLKIFSIMHKPLYIPYERITGAEKGKMFSVFIKFSVDKKKITIYGSAADELFTRLAAAGNIKSTQSSR